MMLFRERQQIIILCLAAVLVGGIALFRLLPLHRRTKSALSRLAEGQCVVAKASAESKHLSSLKEELLKVQGTIRDCKLKVPDHGNLGSFLQIIADLMNEHNLKEQFVQPGKEIQAGVLKCIPVSMQCKGNLAQVFEFYKSLQALDRLIRIEQVNLVNGIGFSGEVSMRTEAVIYFRPAVTHKG